MSSNVFNFIFKLYSKPNITNALVQDIIEGVSELFSNEIISHLKTKVLTLLSSYSDCNNAELEDMFSILENPFSDFKSKHLRVKHLKSNN